MVDAELDENFDYSELKSKDLPSELKGKSEDEIKTYIKAKRNERKQLQNQISDLNVKRQHYISKNTERANNGLENAMIKAIKSQGKKKNYYW